MLNGYPAHVYDTTDPLDGSGNGVGGQGAYMLLGDDRISGTSDDEYRGIAVFNTAALACPAESTKTLAIYHYGTIGSGWTSINLSLLNMSSSSLAASDYQKTSTSANFIQINASSWTDTNDAWVNIDITNQWNTATSAGYPYTGIRFDPQWYINDSTEDAVQISTTGTQAAYVKCG
jgi:hypothetical protein